MCFGVKETGGNHDQEAEQYPDSQQYVPLPPGFSVLFFA
jgi:hypothetical protein